MNSSSSPKSQPVQVLSSCASGRSSLGNLIEVDALIHRALVFINGEVVSVPVGNVQELAPKLVVAPEFSALEVADNDARHDYNESRFLCSIDDRPTADLVAAAPKLLDACRANDELISSLIAYASQALGARFVAQLREAGAKTEAAIAKAEGRT